MKKLLKFTLLGLMIAGIYFSCFNFISKNLDAISEKDATWIKCPGGYRCGGYGQECYNGTVL